MTNAISDGRSQFDNALVWQTLRHCAEGDILSCRAGPNPLDIETAGACADVGCNDAALQRDCERGYPVGCYLLAERRHDAATRRLATAALAHGCDLGIYKECELAILSPESSSQDKHRLERWACTLAPKHCAPDPDPYWAIKLKDSRSRPASSGPAAPTQLPGALDLAREADRMLTASVPIDYTRPMSGPPLDRSAVRDMYWRACEAGDPRSCWMVREVGDNVTQRENLLQRVAENCRRGDAMSCRSLDARWQRSQHASPLSADHLREGCSNGLMSDCEGLQLSPTASVDDLAHIVRQRCITALYCLPYVDPTTSEPVWVPDVLERGCQYANWNGECEKLVELYDAHELEEPVRGRANQLREWVCRQPRADKRSCAEHPAK